MEKFIKHYGGNKINTGRTERTRKNEEGEKARGFQCPCQGHSVWTELKSMEKAKNNLDSGLWALE